MKCAGAGEADDAEVQLSKLGDADADARADDRPPYQAQGCHAIDLRELKAAMRSLGFEVKNEELKMMMAMATASPRFSL